MKKKTLTEVWSSAWDPDAPAPDPVHPRQDRPSLREGIAAAFARGLNPDAPDPEPRRPARVVRVKKQSTDEFIRSDPDAEVRDRLRGIATEDEISALLGTPWPFYRGATSVKTLPRIPDSEFTVKIMDAHIHAWRVGGRFVLRGSPIRGRELTGGYQKTHAFGEIACRLYDLLASRIPPNRRKTLSDNDATPSSTVFCRFSMRAANLAADILNACPTWCDPYITGADIKSRVQARDGRRSRSV